MRKEAVNISSSQDRRRTKFEEKSQQKKIEKTTKTLGNLYNMLVKIAFSANYEQEATCKKESE